MSRFTQITPEEFNVSPFRLIGDEWMLISAPDDTKESGLSAMTASWGGLGVLWNENIATVYIRPQRYTYSLVEKCDRFALCFFDEDYKKALRLCGSKSGRDLDKLKECGLTSEIIDGVSVISEAKTAMICKKLYADDLKEDKFIDREHLSHYNGDFHRFYIVKIEKILVKQ